jgi:uracil-DNA glycosylase family 4
MNKAEAPLRYVSLDRLLADVRSCRACEATLPHGPRPVLQAGKDARVLIVGQAPGSKVHASGIPFDDASGKKLRSWLGVESAEFYNPAQFAIIPMGYCYPGRGKGGDMPPRPECAELWLDKLLQQLPNIELIVLIGLHAQKHFLGKARKASLTETVRAWREYGPTYFPVPHPSPRNTPWFQHNPWFENELVPVLRARIAHHLRRGDSGRADAVDVAPVKAP